MPDPGEMSGATIDVWVLGNVWVSQPYMAHMACVGCDVAALAVVMPDRQTPPRPVADCGLQQIVHTGTADMTSLARMPSFTSVTSARSRSPPACPTTRRRRDRPGPPTSRRVPRCAMTGSARTSTATPTRSWPPTSLMHLTRSGGDARRCRSELGQQRRASTAGRTPWWADII
jgi:hypothetical protein